MAFIRKKRVRGQLYYSLVESHRVNGKVRQTVLASLGRSPTIAGAYAELEHQAALYREAVEYGREHHRRGRFLASIENGLHYRPVGIDAEPILARIEARLKTLEQYGGNVVTNAGSAQHKL